jgi:hypothetical protein
MPAASHLYGPLVVAGLEALPPFVLQQWSTLFCHPECPSTAYVP